MHALKENRFCAIFAMFDMNYFWFDLTVHYSITTEEMHLLFTILSCIFCDSSVLCGIEYIYCWHKSLRNNAKIAGTILRMLSFLF